MLRLLRKNNIAIHQILTALSYGDAISNDAIEIRNILRKMGYKSEIFAKYIDPKVSKFTKNLKKYKPNSHNIVIYHYGLAGFDVTDFVKHLSDIKMLIYHNITPARYFKNINDELYNVCRVGRNELKNLNNSVKLALGDSEYNVNELKEYGFDNTGVLPIIIDFSKYNQKPNKKIIEKYDDDFVNLLFVGRISPNKKQEDLIKIFYYYKKINPKSRLFIVGSYKGMKKYYMSLLNLVKKLSLDDVIFTGHTSFNDLIAYYNISNIFVCMSEHEGFCVPLIESMYFNIPIIAYNSTAVPYTLGKSGILVNKKEYKEIAEMINLVVNDKTLKDRILYGQKMRLKDFDKMIIEEKFKNYIKSIQIR